MSFCSPDERVQPAAPSDWPAVTTLLATVGLPYDDLSTEALSYFRVLREEGSVKGCVGLEPAGPGALLRSLAVYPGARGRGYGSALVRNAEAFARREGIEALYLLTTTAADFFATLGYEHIDREEVPAAIAHTDEFCRICPDTATCMQKSLIP